MPVSAGINVKSSTCGWIDSRRSLDMFQKLHIPVAGIIENMSGFICPSCNTESDIFDNGNFEEVGKREYGTQA